jgi:hypothetical protein
MKSGSRALVRVTLVLVGGLLAAAMIGGCGASSTVSCVRQPRVFSPYAIAGSELTVTVGQIVYAVEQEPEDYLTYRRPSAFPWLPPSSSGSRVLTVVTLCKTSVFTFSIPERVFAFRAARPGRATLRAPLSAAWRSVKERPAPYVATITVRAAG